LAQHPPQFSVHNTLADIIESFIADTNSEGHLRAAGFGVLAHHP